MEKRKENLRGLQVCRFCLTRDEPLSSMYDRSRTANKSVSLPLQIMACVAIEVFPSDGMPSQICDACRFFMDQSYQFKQVCRQADETLLQYVQNGDFLESVPWPEDLLKTMHMVNGGEDEGEGDEAEVSTVLADVGGGKCVQVSTSQGHSDSDDGDADVFNIKIETEGGEQQGAEGSAHIKVVAGGEQLQITTDEPETSQNGFSTASKLSRHVRLHAGVRPYPCKYCHKTFIKSHHYTRHLRLKHGHAMRSSRGPFGAMDQYRCDQCTDSFVSQDDLIYHSAIHATQNLTCPLCKEQFLDVDTVTAHIKSHIEGEQFMCDLCELVFTSDERLDAHLRSKHEEELRHEQDMDMKDEDSMDPDMEEEDDEEEAVSVKGDEENDSAEITKTNEFTLPDLNATSVTDDKQNTNSEESESEVTYTELSTVDTLAIVKQQVMPVVKTMAKQTEIKMPTPTKQSTVPVKSAQAKVPVKSVEKIRPIPKKLDNRSGGILRKAEEVKKRVEQLRETETKQGAPPPRTPGTPKANAERVDSSAPSNTSDKSLRLLEKELQDLIRTRNADSPRSRRGHIPHTSTPKPKGMDNDKKPLGSNKFADKRADRRPTPIKECKESKESRDTKESKDARETKEVRESKDSKDSKEVKDSKSTRLQKDKEARERRESKEAEHSTEPKAAKVMPKNSTNSRESPPRRSSRPNKVKDYAKMIRERSHMSSDESSEESSEEEMPSHRPPVSRSEGRGRGGVRTRGGRTPIASAPTPVTPSTPMRGGPRKRGRPRKDRSLDTIAPKIKKTSEAEEEKESVQNASPNKVVTTPASTPVKTVSANESPVPSVQKVTTGNTMLSPSGQTLTKVPVSVIKSLPPGMKALPLPPNARTMGTAQLCEMKIGKKIVKVQKIIMSKAEVEEMAKKGLVEMKDGTMVLKQGIKLPASGDPAAIKSTLLVRDSASSASPKPLVKESPPPAPTRCDLEDTSQ